MNEMQTLNYNVVTTKEVRMVMQDGEPWWVAADVCAVLDIANPTQAVGRLDEDERAMLNIGRQGETNIVNEFGLYNLILGSRKPEAKAFKRWVTHEVLPQIRATGSYHGTGTERRETLIPIDEGEKNQRRDDAAAVARGKVAQAKRVLRPPLEGVVYMSNIEMMQAFIARQKDVNYSTSYAGKLIRKRALQASAEGLDVSKYYAAGKKRRGNNALFNVYYATELGCEYIREHIRDGAQRNEFEAFCDSWFREHR